MHPNYFNLGCKHKVQILSVHLHTYSLALARYDDVAIGVSLIETADIDKSLLFARAKITCHSIYLNVSTP